MAVKQTNKQSKNIVRIQGVLVENSLKPGTYKNSEGKEIDYIAGGLTIRVNQMISGKEEINEIPVNMWVAKITSTGKPNPAYDSALKAINNYTSLAVCDNESQATKISITSGSINENIFSPDGDKVYCTPKISTSFVNTAPATTYSPEATFLMDVVVGQIDDETDPKDGSQTGRLKIKGMVCRYNGTMDTLDFYVENQNAIDYIRSYWSVGDTVQISGKIRFTVKTEQIEIPTRFGEPQFKTRTTNTRELIITADSTDVLTAEQKFTEDEIKAGLAKRTELIEAAKEKGKKANGGDLKAVPTGTANPYGF